MTDPAPTSGEGWGFHLPSPDGALEAQAVPTQKELEEAQINRAQANWASTFNRLVKLRKEEEKAFDGYYFVAIQLAGNDNNNLRVLLKDLQKREKSLK